MVPEADPQEAARALASLRDEATVRTIMNRLDPVDAARLVAHAPNVEAQTRLIWSLEKPRRAAVMDHLPSVNLAALIQNQERRNRRLLGDVSVEGFAQILQFCSPKQQYYWLSLANSFADAGANLLVLLLPPEQVAEALLTVPEFGRRLHRLRAYITDGFDVQPPVDDPRLKAVLVRLCQYDSDRYYEVLDAALKLVEEGHAPPVGTSEPDEPIMLDRVPELPPLKAGNSAIATEASETEAPASPFLPMPAPVESDSLMRAAHHLLTPARRRLLEREVEDAFRREVLADGGSVAMRDLERAAARLRAYVRLGLQGVPTQPDQVAEVLESVPLRDIIQRGSVALEQLRQIALRLRPFEAALDARQRDLVGSLIQPQTTIDASTGEPALLVPAVDRRRRPEAIPVSQVQERLADASVWVAMARALGVRSLTEKLAAAPNGSLAVSAALGVSLLLHGRWESDTLESSALRRFRDRFFDRERGCWREDVPTQVRQAAGEWAAQAGIETSLRPRVADRVLHAMEQLAEFLRTRRSASWERFAPGKRPSRRRQRVSLEELEEYDVEEAER